VLNESIIMYLIFDNDVEFEYIYSEQDLPHK
jgi:hypothetical protein